MQICLKSDRIHSNAVRMTNSYIKTMGLYIYLYYNYWYVLDIPFSYIFENMFALKYNPFLIIV